MSDWTSGYVADIGYTFGYYSELNPRRMPLAFLNAGLAAPEGATACELGFGQGISVNIHAAASGTQWFGTDFNPAQAGFARALAAASGPARNSSTRPSPSSAVAATCRISTSSASTASGAGYPTRTAPSSSISSAASSPSAACCTSATTPSRAGRRWCRCAIC